MCSTRISIINCVIAAAVNGRQCVWMCVCTVPLLSGEGKAKDALEADRVNCDGQTNKRLVCVDATERGDNARAECCWPPIRDNNRIDNEANGKC